jgi:lambda family phage portal protein
MNIRAKSRPRNKPKSTKPKPKKAGGKSSSLSVRNQYEAGSMGRRLGGWLPGMGGPNQSVLRDLTQLRNRSRDLVRNNPWITRGVNSWVANEVGCGITFKASTSDTNFNELADDLWDKQCQYFDADGMFDFSGMLSQIVRTRRAAGEIFIRRRLRRPSDGLPVPLQYQLIEPELCPHDKNEFVSGGRTVRAGIEFDPIGKRRAYWMYRSHPADFFMGQFRDLEIVAVPAESVIHHYAPLRPGQIRGVPAIVQALVKAKDFDEYDDAELIRKKNRSAFTGAIQRPNYTPDVDDLYDPLTGEPINKDFAGIPVTDIQAGQFFSLLPGEEAKLFEGDSTGSGYADFVRQQLRGIGVGQDVPYEFISGDFSSLNDRTLRVVLAEYHRCVEQDRWQLTIPQVCYPIWRDFIDMAILSGALPEPVGVEPEDYHKVACHPEGWPYLHELQDANAAVVRWENGLTSRKRLAAERGEDIREIDEENAEDQKRAEQLGLEYGAKPAPANQTANNGDPNNPNNGQETGAPGY